MTRRIWLTAVIALMGFAGFAAAHHSLGATYDPNTEITLEGEIAQLQLRNPHSFLHIDVPDENGKLVRWSLEWRSSGSLGQQGIKRNTLRKGDKVIVTINPSRTKGDTRGALKTLHRVRDGFGWGTKPGEVTN